MYNSVCRNDFLLSDKRQTKNVNLKIDQCFERFCVRQTSDKRRKHDIKSFVGFAYYQQQDDINGSLCSFHSAGTSQFRPCNADAKTVV